MKSDNFLIRADASRQIGTGHIMRMIALGQQLQAMGQTVHFFTIPYNQGVMERIKAEGFIVHLGECQAGWRVAEDAKALAATAESIMAKWVILDGYQYSPEYQHIIKSKGLKLLCVDDLAEYAFSADAVLNQNLHARPEQYTVGKATSLFLGPRFALLRKEFSNARSGFQGTTPKKVEKILISLGGCDPENITGQVLSALDDRRMQSVRVKAIVGCLNPHREEILKLAKTLSYNVQVLTSVTTQMPQLLRWADLGVTAAGSITLEALYMELPCFVISLASNQDSVLDRLRKENLAYCFNRKAISDGTFKRSLFNILKDERKRRVCIDRMRAIGIGGQLHEVLAKLTGDLEVRFINRNYVEDNLSVFCEFSRNFIYSPWQAENFLKELPGKWDYSAVALKNDRIVGFTFNSLKQPSTLYIHLLMVDEQYRGAGIGTLLTRSIAAKAKHNTIRFLRLRCPVDNQAASGFYRSLGFLVVKVLDDELSYPHKDYLLSKDL